MTLQPSNVADLWYIFQCIFLLNLKNYIKQYAPKHDASKAKQGGIWKVES